MRRSPVFVGVAVVVAGILVAFVIPRLREPGVALPNICLDGESISEYCVAQLLDAYRADGNLRSGALEREQVLIRMASRPVVVTLLSAAVPNPKRAPTIFSPVASQWQREINMGAAPSALPAIVLDILFARTGAAAQDDQLRLMIDPRETALPQNRRASLGVQSYYLGTFIPDRALTCKAELIYSDRIVVGAIATANLADSGTAPEAPLSARDTYLLKACLFHAMGAPALTHFNNDAQLAHSIRIVGAFRACLREKLAANAETLDALDNRDDRQRLATCMTESMGTG